MKTIIMVLTLTLLSSVLTLSNGDPDPLQDHCVADPNSKVFVNGAPCKDPKTVTPEDFTSTVLRMPPDTNNTLGFEATLVNVTRFPGLNTQGLSFARIAFGPSGVDPPHNHQRSTEVIYVVKGRLYVGFVDTKNKLFAKVLSPNDLFIFPRGLIHFQYNVDDKKDALAFSAFGSQNPGRSDAAEALFNTDPDIDNAVLQKTFQIDQAEVKQLRASVRKT